MPNSGFSLWRHVFENFGATTTSLTVAPTADNLKKTDIYIIVDPDTKDETENPHYVEQQDIKAISDWVKAGGVLVLMANDVGNAELDHFSRLGKEFGIQFNKDSRNRVPGNEFEKGLITISDGHPIFKTARRLYLKELSTLAIVPPAKSIVVDKGDVIMAVSQLGKGTVFAVGDPWFYNEYLDGRKLPPEFENYKAAQDLAKWLIMQSRR
jgi:unsaturated rhamnogalacturonyl hydrolase